MGHRTGPPSHFISGMTLLCVQLDTKLSQLSLLLSLLPKLMTDVQIPVRYMSSLSPPWLGFYNKNTTGKTSDPNLNPSASQRELPSFIHELTFPLFTLQCCEFLPSCSFSSEFLYCNYHTVW